MWTANCRGLTTFVSWSTMGVRVAFGASRNLAVLRPRGLCAQIEVTPSARDGARYPRAAFACGDAAIVSGNRQGDVSSHTTRLRHELEALHVGLVTSRGNRESLRGARKSLMPSGGSACRRGPDWVLPDTCDARKFGMAPACSPSTPLRRHEEALTSPPSCRTCS